MKNAVPRIATHNAGAAFPVLVMPAHELFTDADQLIFGQLQTHLLVRKIKFGQQKSFPPAALDVKETF